MTPEERDAFLSTPSRAGSALFTSCPWLPRKRPVAMKKKTSAWEFVSHMKEEWNEADWSDFYHAVDRALKTIARRHRGPSDKKTEPLLKVTKL